MACLRSRYCHSRGILQATRQEPSHVNLIRRWSDRVSPWWRPHWGWAGRSAGHAQGWRASSQGCCPRWQPAVQLSYETLKIMAHHAALLQCLHAESIAALLISLQASSLNGHGSGPYNHVLLKRGSVST